MEIGREEGKWELGSPHENPSDKAAIYIIGANIRMNGRSIIPDKYALLVKFVRKINTRHPKDEMWEIEFRNDYQHLGEMIQDLYGPPPAGVIWGVPSDMLKMLKKKKLTTEIPMSELLMTQHMKDDINTKTRRSADYQERVEDDLTTIREHLRDKVLEVDVARMMATQYEEEAKGWTIGSAQAAKAEAEALKWKSGPHAAKMFARARQGNKYGQLHAKKSNRKRVSKKRKSKKRKSTKRKSKKRKSTKRKYTKRKSAKYRSIRRRRR
jgi:hypothetical protein